MANNEISHTDQKLPKGRLKISSKNARIAAVAIMVLCVGVATIIYVYHKKSTPPRPGANNKDFPVAPLLSKDKIAQPTSDYAKTIAAVDKLTAAQDTEGSIKLLEAYEPSVTDPAQQYTIDVRLGTLYLRNKNYNASVTWYEKAQQTGQPGSANQYINIAVAAEKAGDIPTAISAYRKHIELLKQQSESSNQDAIKQYEAKVKSLGG